MKKSAQVKRKKKISFSWKSLLVFFLMMPVLFIFTLYALPFTLPKVEAATGINRQMNFQGKLVDNNGLNVADSTYTVVFSIYNVSSSGSNSWTESDNVTTSNGVFQVTLGAVNPLPGNVDFNSDTWYLGIKVGSDAEMTPRIRFTAVPYALNAGALDGVVATNSATQFTITGGTNALLDLTVNGSLTLGSIIKPTAAGALTVQSNGANGLTLDTGGAAALNIGTTANSIVFGATNNPTYAFNGSGTVTFQGTSFTLGNGLAATIQTTSNAGLALLAAGTGNITLGSTGRVGSVIVQPDAGGNAALIINKQGGLGQVNPNLFVASASGILKFALDSGGNATSTGTLTLGAGQTSDIDAASATTLKIGASTQNGLTLGRSGAATTVNGSSLTLGAATGVSGALTVTSNSATSLTVGANGSTNPAFKVDSSTASQQNGLIVTGSGSSNAVTIGVAGGGTNIPLTISANGSGALSLNTTGTGNVSIGNGTGTLTLTLGSDATGDIFYRGSGGGLTRLADVGTGSCLTSGGVGVAPGWGACSAGGGIATIQEGGSSIITSASTLNFTASDFNITNSGGGVGLVAIDYTNSKITRSDQAITVTGGWTFNTIQTTFTSLIHANGGIDTSTTNQDLTIKSNGTGNILIGQNAGSGNIVIQPNAGGQAGLVINDFGSGDIFTASSSGSTKFTIANGGNVKISTNTSGGDDIIKNKTADFTQSGYNAVNVATTNDQLKLTTDYAASIIAPSNGPALPANFGTATTSIVFQRPDGKFVIISGGGTKAAIYDPVSNTFGGGPAVTNTVGAGATALLRQDGKVVIVSGGAATTTTVYDPAGGTSGSGAFSTGVTLSAAAGAGAQVIARADGKFLIILGNASTATSLYDPVVGTVIVGPTTSAAVGDGSYLFQKPDGKWFLGLGNNSATTNLYDPTSNTFTASTALDTGTATTGSSAFQRVDGKFVVVHGGATATSIYDPIANTFIAGPSLTGATNAGAGSLSFQRSDGKFVVIHGGTTAKVSIYDPVANTFSAGTDVSNTTAAGANAFQRPDGKYMILSGTTSTIYDAGWNLNGSWESEDINNTKLSTYSAMLWTATPPFSSLTSTSSANTNFMIKTAPSQGALTNVPYQTVKDSGDLINASFQAAWVKIKIFFNSPAPTNYSGNRGSVSQTTIWLGSGQTAYQRNVYQPAVYDVRIQNPIAQFGGTLANDPTQGRNYATAGATLENLYTDNTNRLQLLTDRFINVATNSGSFFTASAAANLGATAGAGAHAIQETDGRFIVVAGGGTTTTRLYDPSSGNFTAGPALPNNAGAGAHSFQMPDGRYLMVLGNSTSNTAIYDPIANVFYAGPALPNGITASTGANSFQRTDGKFMIIATGRRTVVFDPITMTMGEGPNTTGNIGGGAISLRRPDGRVLIVLGGATTTTNLYDPTSNAFQAGNALSASSTLGGFAAQRPDGKFVVFHGGGTGTSVYDPYQNNSTAAMVTAGTANPAFGTGAFGMQMPDGKILIGVGGGVATAEIYDPGVPAFESANGSLAVANAFPTTITTGSFAFQRTDGKYVVIIGASSTTAIVDTGWNMSGNYVSQPISSSNLSVSTALYWKATGTGGGLNAKYRTASSALGLGAATWTDAEKDGALLNPGASDNWVQIRFDFSGAFQDMPGAKSRIWVGSDSGGQVLYYRAPLSQILQYWKLANTGTPDILTLQSGGLNTFRFTQDGQAFTSANGAWNAGGADLAENYSAREKLLPGQVVISDSITNQSVRPSTSAYQRSLLGIVSTKPGFVAGSYTPDSYPIALVGRVPVLVSTENGIIHTGDEITSSSIPGYAMKATSAGQALGKALEDMDPSTFAICPTALSPEVKCTTIMMFVNLTQYLGQPLEVAMAEHGLENAQAITTGLFTDTGSNSLSDNQHEALSFLENLRSAKDTSNAPISEIFTDRIAASEGIITPKLIVDMLYAKTIKADTIEGFSIFTNKIAQLQSDVTNLGDSLISSESALLATPSGVLNLHDLSLTGLVTVDSLHASEATISGDLRVENNQLVEGVLSVIDTIMTKNILVNGTSDFFGTIIFHTTTTFQKAPVFSKDTAGLAVIHKGATSVDIVFEDDYTDAPIVNVTMLSVSPSGGVSAIFSKGYVYVVANRTHNGFTILLNKPAQDDVTFTWSALLVPSSTPFESAINTNVMPEPTGGF